MKTKNIVFLITFLMIATGMFSQIKFGVRAGVAYYKVPQSATGSILKVQGKTLADKNELELLYPTTGGVGYNFGLFLDYSFGDNFGIMFEPSVSLRNYNEVSKSFVGDSLTSVIRENYIYNKLTYLDLPILFKYNLQPNTGKYGRKSYFSFFAGPQIGINLGKTEVNEVTTSVTIYDQTTVTTSNSDRGKGSDGEDFKIEYNTIDIAAVAGVMYDFEKGFRFGIRYVGSLVPATQTLNFDTYHHSAQFTFGYNFIPQKRRRRY